MNGFAHEADAFAKLDSRCCAWGRPIKWPKWEEGADLHSLGREWIDSVRNKIQPPKAVHSILFIADSCWIMVPTIERGPTGCLARVDDVGLPVPGATPANSFDHSSFLLHALQVESAFISVQLVQITSNAPNIANRRLNRRLAHFSLIYSRPDGCTLNRSA